VEATKDKFWSGDQMNVSQAAVKGIGKGAVSAWNFT